MGLNSSTHDTAWRPYLDFILPRFAALGQSQAHSGSSTRCMVGRQQNWYVAATDRNAERLADDLPRRPSHAIKLHLQARLGSIRPGAARKMPDSRGFLDVCS